MGKTAVRGSYRTKRNRISYGARGLEAMRLMFQVGGFTVEQCSRYLGLTEANAYRVLSGLADHRLTEQAPVVGGDAPARGRPRGFHYLSKKESGRAILIGADEAGVRGERKARAQHRLFQMPSTVGHAHERNEFFLALLRAAERDGGVEVPLWTMWGESYPEFPLPGEGRPRAQERANARMVHERIYPDGVFAVRWPRLSGEFLIELERRSRSEKVMEKIDAYAGRWLELQEESKPPLAFGGFWPVLFILPTGRRAVRMRDRVREASRNEAGGPLGRYAKLAEGLRGRGVGPGWFLLFSGAEEVGRDALGAVWRPLQPYTRADGPVSLRDVAALAEERRRA